MQTKTALLLLLLPLLLGAYTKDQESFAHQYGLDLQTLTQSTLSKQEANKLNTTPKTDLSNIIPVGNNKKDPYMMKINEKMEQLESLKKEMEQKNTQRFPALLYLTSKTVPADHLLNVLESVARVRDILPDLASVQFFRGFDGNFEELLTAAQNRRMEITDEIFQERFRQTVKVKINPILFRKHNVQRVPFLILAECTGRVSPDTCETLFTAQGDVSLNGFLEEAARYDPRWRKASHYLSAGIWQ